MKKILTILLVASIGITSLSAQDAPAPTKGLKYDLNKAGTEYTVSVGSAAIPSEDETFTLVIPESYKSKPVTAIAAGGFIKKQIYAVVIPNSIVTIGEGAFDECKLKSLVIPSSVKTIGKNAFASNQIVDITLNEGLVTLEEGAFQRNFIEGDLVLPKTLKSIGTGAFYANGSPDVEYGDWGIRTVTFKSDTLTIGALAFAMCKKITAVSFEGKVSDIGIGAFCLNSIEEFVIPEGITTLKFCTIATSSLKKIVIPKSVKEIVSSAFPRVSPESVVILGKIPPKVTIAKPADTIFIWEWTNEQIGNFGDLSSYPLWRTNKLESFTVPKGAGKAYEAVVYWQDFYDWMKESES